MSRCNRCGPGHQPDSPAIYETNASNPTTLWTIEKVGENVAIKADSGKYLSLFNNCWYKQLYAESVFVNQRKSTSSKTHWTPEKLANGKIAFKSSKGKYLNRCNNCVTGGKYTDFAFAHEKSSDKAECH